MIIRVKKNTNYTIVSNEVLASKELSLKAKGLYAYMISLPDDWDFSISGLQSCLKEGRDGIRATLEELCVFGVAVYEKKRCEDGTFTSEMIVYQERQPLRESRNGEAITANTTQLSNNRLSNNNKNPTLFYEEEESDKKPKPKRDLLDKKIAMKNDFEEIWTAYPRGRGSIGSKELAEKAYLKALKKASHSDIVSGVKAYKAYLPTQDRPAKPPYVEGFTQRAAYVATWLNSASWANEYDATSIEDETPAERGKRLIEEWAEKEARGEVIVF